MYNNNIGNNKEMYGEPMYGIPTTSKSKARDLIYKQNGRFFSAWFVKKNGKIRYMNCRTGVSKYLKGKKRLYSYDHLLTVYDIQAKGYRTININTLLRLKIDGKHISVSKDSLRDEKVKALARKLSELVIDIYHIDESCHLYEIALEEADRLIEGERS